MAAIRVYLTLEAKHGMEDCERSASQMCTVLYYYVSYVPIFVVLSAQTNRPILLLFIYYAKWQHI